MTEEKAGMLRLRDPATKKIVNGIHDAWVLFHIRQGSCGRCPLSKANNQLNIPCPELREQYPEKCAQLMGFEIL